MTKSAADKKERVIVLGTILSVTELRDYSDDTEVEFDYVINLELKVPTAEGSNYYEVACYDEAALCVGVGMTLDLKALEYLTTTQPLRKGEKIKVTGNLSSKLFTYTRGANKGQTVEKPRLTVSGPKQIERLKIAKPNFKSTKPKPKLKRRTV